MRGRIVFLLFFVVGVSLPSMAFPSVPKASAKALGVTRGKAFSSGLVFINGKYVPPPYVVERWGTGIRINGRKVTGQVIDWNDFLRSQANVKLVRPGEEESAIAAPTPPPPTPPPEPSPAPVAENDVSTATLDDLFSDDPSPAVAKPIAATTAPKASPSVAAAKPAAPAVSYALDGEFRHNAASKRLVRRINDSRTAIDAHLRRGGFIFFGDRYSRVSGDAGAAWTILEKLPELQRKSGNAEEFMSAVRSSGLHYLSDAVSADLYNNRIDYRALQERRSLWRGERDLERLLNGSAY